MMGLAARLNAFLGGRRIDPEEFADLKTVAEVTDTSQVWEWFRFLQSIEIPGWRSRFMTKRIAKLLIDSRKHPLQFYALFCPSYKKGLGEYGVRVDGVGQTSQAGVENLQHIQQMTRELGFACEPPLAIFFDLALEQYTRVKVTDLEKNVANLRQILPTGMRLARLSRIAADVREKVGYPGIILQPLPIGGKLFARIVARGEKFYQLFGWSSEQILDRSRVVVSSEFLVGQWLQNHFPTGILVYTPTMLERAAVYGVPVVFPKKKEVKQVMGL